ncbi:MAG: thioredoxin domain-containing protein [Candidatus Promineifilaceae bacterium]
MGSRRRRSTRRGKPAASRRQTNWVVIGGIIIGAILLVGLLALVLRPVETPGLADFCENNPDNCMEKGEANAPVTVVEVSDYGCSHCRAFNLESAGAIDEKYVQTGEVRWFTVPYALSAQTTEAAESAFCAAEQDDFFAYHEKMFEIQTLPVALTPAGFLEGAGQVGLNLEQFNTCLEDGNYGSLLQQNIRAATNAGVNATPTFFINGVKIEGNNPGGIIQEIDNQLAS